MIRFVGALAILLNITSATWAEPPPFDPLPTGPLPFDLPAPPDLARELIPPAVEKGFKRVPLEHVVKLGKEIPGYQFYLYRRGDTGIAIERELPLETERVTAVPSSSMVSRSYGIVAVPAKLAQERGTPEKLAQMFVRTTKVFQLPAGVVDYNSLQPTRDIKETDSRSKVINGITIVPDEKHGVKIIAVEVLPPPKLQD